MRIDYGNAPLAGSPKITIKKLQTIQNAAARALTRTKRNEHITPILRSLHWLPVIYRIDFKVALLVFKALNGIGPNYIHDMFTQHNPARSLRSQNKNPFVQTTAKTMW